MFSKPFDEREESMPPELLPEDEDEEAYDVYPGNENNRSGRARPYSSKPTYQDHRDHMQA